MKNDILTISMAAEALGVTDGRIRQYIQQKRLKAVKLPQKSRNTWFVRVKDLKSFLKNDRNSKLRVARKKMEDTLGIYIKRMGGVAQLSGEPAGTKEWIQESKN